MGSVWKIKVGDIGPWKANGGVTKATRMVCVVLPNLGTTLREPCANCAQTLRELCANPARTLRELCANHIIVCRLHLCNKIQL